MRTIQINAVDQACNILAGIGCRFKVIDPDGREFGDLVVVDPKPKRSRVLKRKFGELSSYLRKHANFNLPPGEVFAVPIGKYTADEVRRGLTAMCSTKWGNKTYVSSIEDNEVVILRTK